MAVTKLQKRNRALVFSGGGARGAYQVGVWKYLVEQNWTPDLICGTSVGAVNATAIGCGVDMGGLLGIWKSIERGSIYEISWWKQLLHLITRRGYSPLMDTEPFRRLLLEWIDLPKLRKSEIEIVITAVNIIKAQLKFFNNKVIDVEHVMASSAIPMLFPWQYIDGEPYWDGGVMANTPIIPALERQCKEIIVVLLSPVGGSRLPLPQTRRQAFERLFELSLIGSYEAFLSHLTYEDKLRSQQGLFENMIRQTMLAKNMKLATVAPDHMLGFQSMLNFSARQSDALIRAGYNDARHQLAEFFGKGDPF